MAKETGSTRKCRPKFHKCRFVLSNKGDRAVGLAA